MIYARVLRLCDPGTQGIHQVHKLTVARYGWRVAATYITRHREYRRGDLHRARAIVWGW